MAMNDEINGIDILRNQITKINSLFFGIIISVNMSL